MLPCLTLRENTERPLTVSEGTNCVVGMSATRIVTEASRVLDDSPEARRPDLWDGRAGERIGGVLLHDDLATRRRRPTEL